MHDGICWLLRLRAAGRLLIPLQWWRRTPVGCLHADAGRSDEQDIVQSCECRGHSHHSPHKKTLMQRTSAICWPTALTRPSTYAERSSISC